MDDKERANKIARFSYEWWSGDTPTSWDGTEELINGIAQQITEAEKEAYDRGREDEAVDQMKINLPAIHKEGFALGVEAAAKCVEKECKDTTHIDIPEGGACFIDSLATEIRSMKYPEEKYN